MGNCVPPWMTLVPPPARMGWIGCLLHYRPPGETHDCYLMASEVVRLAPTLTGCEILVRSGERLTAGESADDLARRLTDLFASLAQAR